MTESDKRKGYREFWIKGQICHEFEVVNSIKVIDVQAAEDLAEALLLISSGNHLDTCSHSLISPLECDCHISVSIQALAKYRGDEINEGNEMEPDKCITQLDFAYTLLFILFFIFSVYAAYYIGKDK